MFHLACLGDCRVEAGNAAMGGEDCGEIGRHRRREA